MRRSIVVAATAIALAKTSSAAASGGPMRERAPDVTASVTATPHSASAATAVLRASEYG